MKQTRTVLPLLALLGLALSGCSTTRPGEDYSSLPPAPKHPTAASSSTPATTPYPGAPRLGGAGIPAEQHSDLFDRIRAGYSLPDTQHYAVDRELDWYRARPDFLDRTFRRGSRYLHYIVTEIEKRGMPLELALLPVVESAFNPVAYSRSRASGLWQFIPSTGKHYGLAQNWWIDERRDVLRATDAALNYLQYLHRYFNGDWYLAIAAYNGGEGTVSRAVTTSRSCSPSAGSWPTRPPTACSFPPYRTSPTSVSSTRANRSISARQPSWPGSAATTCSRSTRPSTA